MEPILSEKSDFLRDIIDAVPSMIFIVDEDMRIFFTNTAAVHALAGGEEFPLKKKGGEALRCINSTLTPEGCGHSKPCRSCIIRNSVKEASQGSKICRNNAAMELFQGGDRKEVHFSVSASPFEHGGKRFILLLLEDISELIALRSMLPICAHCKKIRDDDGYWQRIDSYFRSRLGVDFSHSICPECMERFYPDYYRKVIDKTP